MSDVFDRVVELEQQALKLKAQLAEFNDMQMQYQKQFSVIISCNKRIERLERQNAELREYAAHLFPCDFRNSRGECNCGLEKALAGKE